MMVSHLAQEFQLDDDASVIDNVRAGASNVLDLMVPDTSPGMYKDDQEARSAAPDPICTMAGTVESASQTAMNELGVPSGASAGRRSPICCCWTNRRTISTPNPSSGWRSFLRDFSGAVLFVTHDRYFLDRVATRIIEIDDARIYSHPGNYSAFWRARPSAKAWRRTPNAAARASCGTSWSSSALASEPAARNSGRGWMN
jgi:ATP-binding cassette subfamily F protein uup